MFDIGFPELMIVFVVALLVIGPNKLPETIRTVAFYVGRIRRSLSNLRTELENEIGADEIRQQLYNESIMDELNQAKSQVQDVINDASSTTEMTPLSKTEPIDDPDLKAEPPTNPPSDNDSARSGT